MAALDTLVNRYVNLHQCAFFDPAVPDVYTQIVPDVPSPDPFTTGTNASNTPAVAPPTCAIGLPASLAQQPLNSGVSALDTLDTTRGRAFVQFSQIAPRPVTTTPVTQTAQLLGPGTGNPASTSTILVSGTTIGPIGPLPRPGPGPGAGQAANALLLRCTGTPVAVLNVLPESGRVRVRGVTTAAFAGKVVSIRLTATNTIVGTAVAGADGSFSKTVPLPARGLLGSDRTRYRAEVPGGKPSPAAKLSRRAGITGVARGRTKVTVRGHVLRPFARPDRGRRAAPADELRGGRHAGRRP